jgi:tRNA A37 threonylcarbamoyladenosine dehydratase
MEEVILLEFSRTQLLLGRESMKRLSNARVAVFGIGGVGSYAVEALIRSGIGAIDLFDGDKVCPTNINRQLIATQKTIGEKKVDVMRRRINEINPGVKVETYAIFYGAENADDCDLGLYDYIIDAIDMVSSKLELIERAKDKNVPIISCMGAGNKLDPTKLEVADISETSVCPLAKVMRKELRRRGITNLKVVYSKEPPITPIMNESMRENTDCDCPADTTNKVITKRQVPGSIAFVPSVAGLILAGEVIKDIAIPERNKR